MHTPIVNMTILSILFNFSLNASSGPPMQVTSATASCSAGSVMAEASDQETAADVVDRLVEVVKAELG